jgi:TRAP-type C4-dicarboxylate transport system permease small subunit
MQRLASALGVVFGYLTLLLGIVVTGETVARKLLDWSLQGADELGGYILAVSACLSFCVALLGRSHMRIDVVPYRLPLKGQAILNWVSSTSIALFSLVLAWASWGIIRDTFLYNSTAPTPWATPLKYPQSIWYAGVLAFALVATLLAAKATGLLLHARWERLAREFEPKAQREELEEELEDARRRL